MAAPTTRSLVQLLGVPLIVGEDEEWRGRGMERMVVVGPPLLLTSEHSTTAAAGAATTAAAIIFFSGERSGCEFFLASHLGTAVA